MTAVARKSEAAGTEALRGAAAHPALASEWHELPQARTPLLSHDWMASAAGALHSADALETLVLREDGQLAAVAPMVRVTRAGAAHLEIAGAEALHEPAGLLYRDAAALEKLCAALVASGLPVVLRRIDVTTPVAQVFRTAARGRGRLFTLAAATSPAVRIDSGWAEYSAGLSSRRRQDFRRARRRLEGQGAVTLDIRQSTPATVATDLAEFIRVEDAGWKSRNGSSLAGRPELRAFFEQAGARFAARGILRTCFLRLDGVAIAAQIGLEEDDRWWILKIGYDEKHSATSPGIQLMWDIVRHAFEKGCKSLEMLGTAEEWLGIWTNEERCYETLVFYPSSVRGFAALALDALSSAWRRVKP